MKDKEVCCNCGAGYFSFCYTCNKTFCKECFDKGEIIKTSRFHKGDPLLNFKIGETLPQGSTTPDGGSNFVTTTHTLFKCIFCKGLINIDEAKDSKMNVDKLSSTIVGRGMEIEELETKNKNYLELIKYLISCDSGPDTYKTPIIKKIIKHIQYNGHNMQLIGQVLEDIAEMLTEDKQ